MAMTDEATDSLRERKKRRTRQSLVEVSQRLFVHRGYTGTTLEMICDEVGIRPQTLLRYFDSKADLALAPWSDEVAALGERLAARDGSTSVLDVWRTAVADEARLAAAPPSAAVGHLVHNVRAFRDWADKDPVLVAMNTALELRLQALLAGALAAEHGADVDDLHSTLVAAMLVTGRRAVFLRWVDGGGRGDLVAAQVAMIDYTVASLPRHAAAGIRDLGR